MTFEDSNINVESRFKELSHLIDNLKDEDGIKSLMERLQKVIGNENIDLIERNLFAKQVMALISEKTEKSVKENAQFMETLDDRNKFLESYRYGRDVHEIEKILKDAKLDNPTSLRFALLSMMEKIKKREGDLYKKLYRLAFEDRNVEVQYMIELPLLNKLIGVLERNIKNPQEAIKEIKAMYPTEIEPRIKKLEETETVSQKRKEEKTLKNIRESIGNISGDEIKFLNFYIRDLKKWKQYLKSGEHISSFIDRVNRYVYGSPKFKGILRDFKDGELVKQMQANFTVKGLMRFIDKYQFIDWANKTVTNAEYKPRWEGFLEGNHSWMQNLDRKENYIGMIEKKFGDKDLSNYLKGTKKKLHQDIKGWGLTLNIIQENLIDSKYQEKFISRCAASLSNVFTKRINELTLKEQKELSKLKKHLKRRIGQIKNETKLLKKKTFKAIDSEREKLDKKQEEIVRLYVAVIMKSDYIKNCKRFEKGYNKVADEYTERQAIIAHELGYFLNIREKAQKNASRIMSRYSKYDVNPFILQSSMDSLVTSAQHSENLAANAFYMFVEDSTSTEELIKTGFRKIVSLRKIMKFIDLHKNDFIIKQSASITPDKAKFETLKKKNVDKERPREEHEATR